MDHFEELLVALKREGFEGVFFQKAGGPRVKDGSAVFWRVSRFQLAEWQGIPLKENIMTAVMVRLTAAEATHGATTRPLVVCSTHLKAGFNMLNEHVRHKQTMELLCQLDAFAKGDPTILGADLNAHHSAYSLCTEKGCNDPGATIDPICVPALLEAGFRSGYGGFPTFTSWSGWSDHDVKVTIHLSIHLSRRALVREKSGMLCCLPRCVDGVSTSRCLRLCWITSSSVVR